MLARQDKLRVMKRESLVFETTNWMVPGEKLYSVEIIAADSDKQFLRPVLKLLKARTRRQRPEAPIRQAGQFRRENRTGDFQLID
ncbi:MAG: hypothetical protein WBL40_15550, partial [Terrimicrobiaceae bacterium]